MAVTRLGQMGIGLAAYAGFIAKTEAAVIISIDRTLTLMAEQRTFTAPLEIRTFTPEKGKRTMTALEE